MSTSNNKAPWLIELRKAFCDRMRKAKRVFAEDDATVHHEGWESADSAFKRIYGIDVKDARLKHLEVTVDFIDHTVDVFCLDSQPNKLIYLTNIWAGEGEIREDDYHEKLIVTKNPETGNYD